MSRQSNVEQLTLVLAELLDQMTTVERYDWWPTRNHPDFAKTIPGPDGKPRWARPLPKHRPRKHETSEPGLLTQLDRGVGRRRAVAKPEPTFITVHEDDGPRLVHVPTTVDASALVGVEAPLRSPSYDTTAASTPGPVHVLEAYVDVVAGIATCRAQMRAAAGKSAGPRQSARASLREIRNLLAEVSGGQPVLDDTWADRALRRAKSWAATARLALAYDAPIVEITGTCCPDCDGRLLVRRDASSSVWCAGLPGRIWVGPAADGEAWPMVDRGCGTTWRRHEWPSLLDQAAG